MITDRIPFAGLSSYLRNPASGAVNLGGVNTTIRTSPMSKYEEHHINGIQLLIEDKDLQPLMGFPFNSQNPSQSAPLFKFSVNKELFPGLFADPYSHRVHNVAGYQDFKEGTLTNGRIMEVDGIPTIVSIGKEECIWQSKEYIMPAPISIQSIAWELGSSKFSPKDSFHYKFKITSKDINGNALPDIQIENNGTMLTAHANRAIDGLNRQNIKSFQITFIAKVYEDSYIQERHLPIITEPVGRPLLRAINLLEPIKSIYEIHSLTELKYLCSDFQIFDSPGPKITRLIATIDLSAVLVNSPNQVIANNDMYDPASQFEYLELKIFPNQFTSVEMRKLGEVFVKNV